MVIDARNVHYETLNRMIKEVEGDLTVKNCMGQRFIAAGRSKGTLKIQGVPGNALGAYLDGATVIANGNAQDATGDTMNDGRIIIHGSSGDATGYAMRGGRMYIKNDVGYRAGIHMKEYTGKVPVMVIGGKSGSFLGEYQAGGLIIVLGLGVDDKEVIGNFCGTGMHGGKIVIFANKLHAIFPKQLNVSEGTEEDLKQIEPHIDEYVKLFKADKNEILKKKIFTLTPNTNNLYKQLYVQN